ncbi:maleylpyruvate isomerase family mycothiol-dependent enzyme [Actinomycetospora sp.]|jgi:uncharacterized protein (TIGR03083 family)|uniref:maleylpyruvate isomerase family mycothiol-dependent enzyme n=1 Tax=Actinomycetospora sp. TaxID=1872135 RepID=UPI002F3E2FD2
MHLAEVYAQSRTRMIELAAPLTTEQQQTTVPATPLWTVADVYRHVAGVPADVLAGRVEGGGSPEWTAAQIAPRADNTLDDVCAEWAETGPKYEELIAAAGFNRVRSTLDLWTHEQDVRGALGGRGDRDDPALPTLVTCLMELLRRSWGAARGIPRIEFVIDGKPHRYGGGEPEITLRTSSYEFVRMANSRRSRAQMHALDWTGTTPERVFDALTPFDLPEFDVVD